MVRSMILAAAAAFSITGAALLPTSSASAASAGTDDLMRALQAAPAGATELDNYHRGYRHRRVHEVDRMRTHCTWRNVRVRYPGTNRWRWQRQRICNR